MHLEETIVTLDDLIKKVSYNEPDQKSLEKINKAFLFAEERHKGMIRNTGSDYIFHPLNVAYILADLNVDTETIVAALLHDLIDKTDISFEEIEGEFGSDIAKICENVAKINKLELLETNEASAMYLRKVLVGMAEDVRVIFIKLADRLHNMRTLWALREEKQKETSNETLNVLIPIAHRLGINSIKSELEDLCLKYLRPDEYNDILIKLKDSRESLSETLTQMQDSISDILTEHGLQFEIKSRLKSIHSIHTKLEKGRKFSDIYDILALRVYVEKENDCYLALGLIHSKYRPIPKRFKDFIARPKSNMYQSLHTSVFGVDGHLFEVQIRTYEMDEIAEKGVASHWSYKEAGAIKAQNIMEQKLDLFRRLIEMNDENISDLEFAKNAGTEFLSDSIYVYSPKGDVIELPKESTPLDFAYRIHSNIGDKATHAIVNNKITSLGDSLNDEDVVEIKTSNSSSPSKEWLKLVKTSQARDKIKAYFNKKYRNNYIEKGIYFLEKEMKKRGLSKNDVFSPKNEKKLLKDLKLKDLEEVYLNIGSLRYSPSYVVDIIYQDKKDVEDILIDKLSSRKTSVCDYKSDIIVAETDKIKTLIATCCKPIKGDEIIGFITKGEGVCIHKINCINIQEDSKRLIEARWKDQVDNHYLVDVKIEVKNNKSYLSDIMNKANAENIFVENFETHNSDISDIYEIIFKVKDKNHLTKYLNKLKNESFIIRISR